ncbi:polyprotein of EF-Ts, chloroplastic-like [Impatiens glandulifera]|uniref:polyprotein of EF-Ts, chloroplastic-like n=1 Tax=Impatiens glandulifera TaxID=253017 RepID=UPI001FB0B4A8|nr:polyprotein of EF-Ts, chloroplastic-like [Impatiens glandulifera]
MATIVNISSIPLLPSSFSLRKSIKQTFLPHFRIIHKLSATATGANLVLEPNSPKIATNPDLPLTDATPIPSNKTRPAVKKEDLVIGAVFTGKVKSIQPFGAFIEFGAFTDGLVHVSQLSDSFVKDVSSVVSIGQEVTVKLLEVNLETKRISLTMREGDEMDKKQQPKYDQKRNDVKKTSKFVKGQDLEGTVKNLTKSGCFISLPDGEEGFLPSSEEADEGIVNLMGGSSLEVGQNVRVRVLRLMRGQVTLTMKKDEDGEELDVKLKGQSVVHKATNPFMLAFLQNKEIAAFMDEKV